MLITTVGAFAAFSLMTIAVGTDYWLYSRGVCRVKTANDNDTSKKNEEVMTHSGLWRTCCLEGRGYGGGLGNCWTGVGDKKELNGCWLAAVSSQLCHFLPRLSAS